MIASPSAYAFGKSPYPPAPSFDRAVEAPDPSITAEIQRLQRDCGEMAAAAIARIAKLRERLIGDINQPAGVQLQEGLRWPPEGDLGLAYHQAYQLREELNRLLFELSQLETV